MKNTNISGSVFIKTGEYLSVASYAKRNDLTRTAVLKQIWNGKIEGIQIGRAWIIKLSPTTK